MMCFNGRSHGVFEKLKEDVVEVYWRVGHGHPPLLSLLIQHQSVTCDNIDCQMDYLEYEDLKLSSVQKIFFF